MRDIKRVGPIMDNLTKLWEKFPDLRFAQLITLVSQGVDGEEFYAEDEVFAKRIKELLDEK